MKNGKGLVSTQSQVLDRASYGFGSRFESGGGTNPEELIGAAHSACFTMAFAGELEKQGARDPIVETEAVVELEKQGEGWTVTAVHLETEARATGISQEAFNKAAESAKVNCPISKLLNARITLNANLVEKAA